MYLLEIDLVLTLTEDDNLERILNARETQTAVAPMLHRLLVVHFPASAFSEINTLEMARVANSPVFGPSAAKGFETVR